MGLVGQAVLYEENIFHGHAIRFKFLKLKTVFKRR
jgi:hypothetical protein